jgi:predicted dehydrogenase
MNSLNRRQFIGRSGQAVLGLSAGAPLLAQSQRTSGGAPNERVVLGAIGTGGRGSSLVRGFLEQRNVAFAYLCDVVPGRAEGLARYVQSRQALAPKIVTDFRLMLEDPAVDAVVVATPDHWHALATIQACQAGKHVYVEKPPCHNIWEGRKMVEAARKHRRLVQVGTENRSAPYVKDALDYLRSGKLGKVHLCKVFNLKSGGRYRMPPNSEAPAGVDFDRWLGPAALRPYNRTYFSGGWHFFFDFCGGDTGDDGIHQLDIARWLLGKDYPQAVHGSGGKLAFPDADGDVPDTQVASFEFDELRMTFELTQWAPYMDKIAQDIRMGDHYPYWPQCATRIEFYGTQGLMVLGRHGGGWQVFTHGKAPSRPGEVVAARPGRFPDPEHKANFLNAIRRGERLNADIEEGTRSAILEHLANIATRLGGRRLVFDAATERFVGDAEANALLKRQYREPYVVPDRV